MEVLATELHLLASSVNEGLTKKTRVVVGNNGEFIPPSLLPLFSVLVLPPPSTCKDLACAQEAFVQLLGQIRPDSKLPFLQWVHTEYNPSVDSDSVIMEESEAGRQLWLECTNYLLSGNCHDCSFPKRLEGTNLYKCLLDSCSGPPLYRCFGQNSS